MLADILRRGILIILILQLGIKTERVKNMVNRLYIQRIDHHPQIRGHRIFSGNYMNTAYTHRLHLSNLHNNRILHLRVSSLVGDASYMPNRRKKGTIMNDQF